MIRNVLQEIGGVGIYGVISLCLFFLVFSTAVVRACMLNKSFLKSMSALPLDDGQPVTPAKGSSHHE